MPPADPSPDADVCGAVRVQAPAKVNLHLSVGLARPDGFHDLVTVFHAVDLVDEVSAAPASGLRITVLGDGAADVPADERNLAWQAAQLLADTAGIAAHAHLTIRKAIPVAGGMAGGSADAAAALVACARLWDLDVGPAELAPLAAQLGSDVTFPLLGGTALGTGRGELLEPVECAAPLHWVFALADHGISAGAAYGELDRQRDAGLAPPPIGAPDSLLAALADGDVTAVAATLGNDLQPAALALAPRLEHTLRVGGEAGALAGIVSGSGPTCAFLCRDGAAANLVAATLEAAGGCRTARVATGPVPGARIAS
ncbi:MAG TPA: 4-(cytidine 5'-diphospho)-2-C-methyl-D-erythritol kinase [Jatrophihabitans sp.]|nr:4-(cytidine 5'-diphospho)-2-C-methyl-D-erythritol kinase [Jatrophihabitans sp.]